MMAVLNHTELREHQPIIRVERVEIDQLDCIPTNSAVRFVIFNADALHHDAVQTAVLFDEGRRHGRNQAFECIPARFGRNMWV